MSEDKPNLKFAVDEKLARFQDLYVKQETGPNGLTDDEEKELIDLYSEYLGDSKKLKAANVMQIQETQNLLEKVRLFCRLPNQIYTYFKG